MVRMESDDEYGRTLIGQVDRPEPHHPHSLPSTLLSLQAVPVSLNLTPAHRARRVALSEEPNRSCGRFVAREDSQITGGNLK